MSHVLIVAIIGVLLGLAIGVIVRLFGVKRNPLVDQLNDLMPGANCGGCGFAGCAAYASAMAEGKAKPGLCASMNDETTVAICTLLGVSAETTEPKVAVVCCSGDLEHTTCRAFYNGVNDCADAMIVAGGAKGCTYGCLGLGTCSRACPFGAIEITAKRIAVVHEEICVGCGKCVAACPRKVIKLVPKSAPIHVMCSSPEKYAVKRAFCNVGCMGCGKCVRTAEEGQLELKAGLAVVNYANPPKAELADVCPAKCLHASPTHGRELPR